MAKIDRYKSTLSIAFSIVMVMLAWRTFQLFGGSYSRMIGQAGLFGAFALVYIILRQMKNATLPKTNLWPLVLAVFAYLVVSLLLTQNFYTGTIRFLYFVELGIFFLIVWDAFDLFLDHTIVLYSLLAITMGLLLDATFEVYTVYQTWWEQFGIFGQSPPFMYRVLSIQYSPNVLAGLINMFFPVVVIFLVKNEKKVSRIFMMTWIILYGFVLYFTSSRGGYVGAGAAVFFLILLNLKHFPLWQKFLVLNRKKKIIWMIIALTVLVVMAFLGFQLLIQMGSHPSHGSSEGRELNLNRTGIWKGYINVWRANPWLGSGIGRLALAFFENNNTSPPGYWPQHAHSLPIGILAELGLFGFILIFSLIILAGITIYQRYRNLPSHDQIIASGVLAGIISLAVHSLVDDFLYWPFVFFQALILIAWLASIGGQPIQRSSRLRFVWLAPVVLGLMACGYWYIQPYQYLELALYKKNQQEESWTTTAKYLDRSVELAPNSQLYLTKAADFWYQAGLETGQPDDFAKAVQYYSDSLEIEPGLSISWLNKSMASWQMGKAEDAIMEAQTAIRLAPDEPVYHLNLGWYYEQIQETEQAAQEYTEALNAAKSLGWHTHPFWQETTFRKALVAEWLENAEYQDQTPRLNEFLEAFRQEDWQTTQQIYEFTRWENNGNHAPELHFMRGMLLLENQDFELAAETFAKGYRVIYHPLRMGRNIWWPFAVYSVNVDADLVPGIFDISHDFGILDSDLIAEINEQLAGQVSDETFCHLQLEIQRAIQGNELLGENTPLPENCP